MSSGLKIYLLQSNESLKHMFINALIFHCLPNLKRGKTRKIDHNSRVINRDNSKKARIIHHLQKKYLGLQLLKVQQALRHTNQLQQIWIHWVVSLVQLKEQLLIKLYNNNRKGLMSLKNYLVIVIVVRAQAQKMKISRNLIIIPREALT